MVAMESKAIVLHQGFGSAAVDLQSLGVTIDSGDAFMAHKKWENAVMVYQTAADQSEAIGASINPSDPAVVQAKGIADGIKGMTWRFASPSLAAQAQALAKQLPALLGQALARNPQATPTAPVKASSSSSSGSNAAVIALWGAVAVGLGVMGYLIFRGPKENPTGGGGKRLGGRALIAKGRGVTFELSNGREIHCSGAMMHDPSGRWWPSRSVLIGPARLRESKVEIEGDAKAYFGRSGGHLGRVNTPPKPLKDWDYLGEVADIFYTRSGRRSGFYRHQFNAGLMSILRGHKKVRLYRRGKFCRLELPRGARLDDRGFVAP
jgi:hypothetical protein